jgi:hypothetical protein
MFDPISLGIGLVGMGVSFFGNQKSAQASKQLAAAQQEQIKYEKQAEAVRMRSMEMDARRKTLETVRQAQRARAYSLATTTAQGASGGSGLMGAYGQASGQAGTQLTGLFGNLGFGREMFDINSHISDARMQIAEAGGRLAEGQALTSLGGSITNNLQPLTSLSKNFGGLFS